MNLASTSNLMLELESSSFFILLQNYCTQRSWNSLYSCTLKTIHIFQNVLNTIRTTRPISFLFVPLHAKHFDTGTRIMAHQMSSSFILSSHPSFLPSFLFQLPSWSLESVSCNCSYYVLIYKDQVSKGKGEELRVHKILLGMLFLFTYFNISVF